MGNGCFTIFFYSSAFSILYQLKLRFLSLKSYELIVTDVDYEVIVHSARLVLSLCVIYDYEQINYISVAVLNSM
jgi:hypothetical protein